MQQFNLPDEIAEKGNEMLNAYYISYCFENFLRLFIEQVSSTEYGNEYWSKLKINTEIQQKINARKNQENVNLWISIRGNSNLFYLDFDELRRLIESNWDDLFQPFFPDREWISVRLKDIYKIRNLIAHNSYITKKDQSSLSIFVRNIYDQLKINFDLSQKKPDFVINSRSSENWDAMALAALGNTYYYQKKYDLAESCFKKAIELDNAMVVAYAALGNLYYILHRYTDAEENFNIALRLEPENNLVLTALGNLYFSQKRFAEAEKMLKKATGFTR
ncbi:MAG: hypothetical protein RBG13Loki_0946 [Promethearchaeota archaeon CR_4]|nr:MAG: hypothetical protein RBG13Loki_0946 [Candidatus Lokiarchaeota archaeon CR_4]